MKQILFISLLTVSASMMVNAQNVGTATSVQVMNIVIKDVFDLNINTGKAVTFTFDKLTDYDNGIEALNANTIKYRTNQAWKINVKATNNELTRIPGNTGMSEDVIMVRQSGAKNYIPVSGIDQEVAAGARGTSNFNIDYKANPGYGYQAGTYAMTLQYTLTNQ